MDTSQKIGINLNILECKYDFILSIPFLNFVLI